MRKQGKFILVFLALLAIALQACSSGSAEATVENTALAESDAELSESADCPPVSTENALFIFEDVEQMTLLTSAEGGGPRPLLSWEIVEGAASYRVVLFAENDEPYWSWQGEESGIYVGGITEAPPPPEVTVGPIVLPCMTWMTTAYNAEGVPIAAGGPRLISP